MIRVLTGRVGVRNILAQYLRDLSFENILAQKGNDGELNPEIQVVYYNQPTLWLFLKKQLLHEAPYNAYMWYLAPYTFTFRHAITSVFAMEVIGGLLLSYLFPLVKGFFFGTMALYFFLGVLSAFQQSLRYRKFFHLITQKK